MTKTNCKLVPFSSLSVDTDPTKVYNWIDLLNRPIPVTDETDTNILGFVVPGSIVICGDWLCGSIDGILCDFSLYEWCDVSYQFANGRFVSIAYKLKEEQNGMVSNCGC